MAITEIKPSIKKGWLCAAVAAVLASCSGGKVTDTEEMVHIPPGEFIMGSVEEDTEGLAQEFGSRKGTFFMDERPERKVRTEGYYIGKYEVTNSSYKKFVDAGHQPPLSWEGGAYPDKRGDHPVNNVTWFDAEAYCKWAGKRLPTEEEWEKAARGPDGNRYPWGDEYDEAKANLNKGDTAPVGSHETDVSHYGVYDMAGNVMEWVDAWYKPYPGGTFESKEFGEKYRVLRGSSGSAMGHYVMGKIFSRSSFRHHYLPGGAGNDGGFRCASSAG
ncbi:MAG: SUMF1/EgtB/PvdO family nonheme iron enzyme [Thermodesulfobacteriota bacterium]